MRGRNRSRLLHPRAVLRSLRRPGAAWVGVLALALAAGGALRAPSRPVSTAGTPPAAPAARPVNRMTVWVTAYCPTCRTCETDGVTATGSNAFRPGVAVGARKANRAVPLGSRVRIPGYGWLAVDDTGGKVGRAQLDLRMASHRAAVQWGRRRLVVQVAEQPSAPVRLTSNL